MKFLKNLFCIFFHGCTHDEFIYRKKLDKIIDQKQRELFLFRKNHPRYFLDQKLRLEYHKLLFEYANLVDEACDLSGYNDSIYGIKTKPSREIVKTLLEIEIKNESTKIHDSSR